MASPTVGASTITTDGSGASPYTSSQITTQSSGSAFFVVIATSSGSTISSVTDSKSNTYSLVTTILEANDGVRLHLYGTENGTGGASHDFTANFSAGGGYGIGAIEVIGAPTSSVIDVTNTQYDQTSPFVCAVTTTEADTLLLAFIMTAQAGGGTFSVGGSFSIDQQASVANPMAIASRAGATATTYDPAWTHSLYSAMARITIAVKSAGGGGTPNAIFYIKA